MPCSHSVEEVRQTVQEAMEHDNDPNYWITWEEIDEEFRNRYSGWKYIWLFMKKNKGKFDFKGDWAEGKTAEEYADDLRSTCSFTRKVETW